MTEAERGRAQKAIMRYPLPFVVYRLEKEGNVPKEEIPGLVLEFRRFIICILHSDSPVGMISPVIDEVWHAFILHTREYAEFCQSIFGRFVHHAPNWPEQPLSGAGGSQFRNVYGRLFGQLPEIWTNHLDGQGGECSGTTNCQDPDCGDESCWTGCTVAD